MRAILVFLLVVLTLQLAWFAYLFVLPHISTGLATDLLATLAGYHAAVVN